MTAAVTVEIVGQIKERSAENSDGNKSIADPKLADTDDRHEATAGSTFLAVTEEQVAAAGGAEIAEEDVCGAQAGVE